MWQDKQCVKQVLNKCLCTVKWRQWRSKLKQKKCKPSLGPGVKTVWRRLQSSNKSWPKHSFRLVQTPDNPSGTYVLNDSAATQEKLWHHCAQFEQANACIDETSARTWWQVKQDIRQAIRHLLAQRCHSNMRKRSKDCLPDVMEISLSTKTSAEQQTTYCFVKLSGCVQW